MSVNMRFVNKLKSAFSHPFISSEKVYDRLRILLYPTPVSPIVKPVNNINFHFDFGLDSSIPRMYLGIYEKDTIKALRRYLDKGGIFIDIGANIGYISANAAAFVGKDGEIHSFEPVPAYYERLTTLSKLNPEYNFFFNNCALGEKAGKTEMHICGKGNIGWNTMVPNFMESEVSQNYSAEVEVIRLDEYLRQRNMTDISLIKIDTEGYEFPVLKGMSSFWEKHPQKRPPIIVEICPSSIKLLGYTLDDMQNYMEQYSYHSFTLDGKKSVLLSTIQDTRNVLFFANCSRNPGNCSDSDLCVSD